MAVVFAVPEFARTLSRGQNTHDSPCRSFRSSPALPGADAGSPRVIAGAISFRAMPVDAYPDLSPPMVEIITQWPGHAAEEIERLVSLPIEVQMNGMPHMAIHAVDFALRPLGRDPDVPGQHGRLLRAASGI